MIFEYLSNMTIKNPIFMIIFFAALWYIPGIILRRRVIYLQEKKKREIQDKRINALYPKAINKDNSHK